MRTQAFHASSLAIRSNPAHEMLSTRPLEARMNTYILGVVNGSVSHLPRRGERDRLRSRPATAKPYGSAASSDERPVGRAWINGREIGGTADRLAHLVVGHD
jgi:hypothetical protein